MLSNHGQPYLTALASALAGWTLVSFLLEAEMLSTHVRAQTSVDSTLLRHQYRSVRTNETTGTANDYSTDCYFPWRRAPSSEFPLRWS
jgi:hypothetical protein